MTAKPKIEDFKKVLVVEGYDLGSISLPGERYRLREGFGAQPAPAAKQIRQLPLGKAEGAGEPLEIGNVRPILAEITDRGLHDLVVGLRYGSHELVHAATLGENA
jgi:hypothetical protein